MSVKLLASIVSAAGLILGQQMREGNLDVRFEPTAKMQTGAPIPFNIVVRDALKKPFINAQVTLQIEKPDHSSVNVYPAPQLDRGTYLAKPVFPSPGTWEVIVDVRRGNQETGRTVEFHVPE